MIVGFYIALETWNERKAFIRRIQQYRILNCMLFLSIFFLSSLGWRNQDGGAFGELVVDDSENS